MNFGKDEYEIQHYGFSLNQLTREHKSLVKHNIKESVKAYVKKLLQKLETLKVSPTIIAEIREKTNITSEKIFDSVQDRIREFDLLVEKHFSIPHNVLLPEDFAHEDGNCTEQEEQLLKEELYDMEKTFKQNCYLTVAMEAELEMYKSIQKIIDKEETTSESVQKTLDECNSRFTSAKLNTILEKLN